MTNPVPTVTVVIPAHNEAPDIERCLSAVAHQDYPMERLEVVVVSGGSTDDTAARAQACLAAAPFGSSDVLTGTTGTTPSNLNAGLARATGDIVCRVDARSLIEPHHVRRCANVLAGRPDVAVVGGAQRAVARDASAVGLAIARALNNRWAMGGSAYRRATRSGPSDTVYLGAFRRRDLQRVGGWDERLATNQDFDLNQRLAGLGLVWFEATLRTGYLPRSTVSGLWAQYRRFGRWKVRYWRLTATSPSPRQRLLLAAPVVATTLVVATSLRIGAAATGLVVACGALLVDHAGSAEPAPLRVRALATVLSGMVSLGWWTGVVAEVLQPQEEDSARAAG